MEMDREPTINLLTFKQSMDGQKLWHWPETDSGQGSGWCHGKTLKKENIERRLIGEIFKWWDNFIFDPQNDMWRCIWYWSGVDFIKVGRKAPIIEIALSKLGARHKARHTPVKSFSKVERRAQIGRKKFMKSTPELEKWLQLNKNF